MKRNSKGNNHYHNKRPPFRPDPEHWTRKSSHGWKAKVSYDTERGLQGLLMQSVQQVAHWA